MEHKYCIGEIVELKKQHPCGSKQWEITRVGADFKIKCLAVSIRLCFRGRSLKRVSRKLYAQ
ncbi:hypothetical protein JCM21531_4393 [Acetivibrio straminisolvens JCM 21531]|uniref:DUF951 domain-containing protein n=1 Tax=Acetivibrio straminisolvens JCM 21531 TaxID=1294263 RepID=W4VC32_9FIRM|nr:hypothetical protein JCM21531_4393 [Acetivibrio straminisolvens JCM 21531]